MEIKVENTSPVGRNPAGVTIPPEESKKIDVTPAEFAEIRRRPEVYSVTIPEEEKGLKRELTAFDGVGEKRAETIRASLAEYDMSLEEFLDSDVAREKLPDNLVDALISQLSEDES